MNYFKPVYFKGKRLQNIYVGLKPLSIYTYWESVGPLQIQEVKTTLYSPILCVITKHRDSQNIVEDCVSVGY